MSKKLFGFALLVFAASFLTACGGGADEYYQDDPVTGSLEGILSEQIATDSEPGTHFLTLDSGDKTSLNSLEINLSDVAYLKNKVKTTGVMNEEDGIFTVTGISVLEILSDEKAEVIEFVDFENSDLGFNLKYYNDWTVGSGSNTVIFTAPESEEEELERSSVVITQSMFAYEPSIDPDTGEQDSALAAYKADKFPWLDEFGEHMSKIGPDQLDAIKTEEKAGAIIYYLYRFGLIYEIKFDPGEDASNTDDDLKEFNEMLSEFKFTPFEEHVDDLVDDDNVAPEGSDALASDIPDIDVKMGTFESLLFEFSAKLPASWYYAGSSQPGTLHHYGFSDEVVEDDNEIIGLDVLAESAKAGSGVITETVGDQFYAYTEVDGQYFRFFGPSEYSDLITVMANGIEALETKE